MVAGYEAVTAWWPNFVPSEHPAILVERDDADEIVGAITVNYPDPSALGEALLVADHPETGAIYQVRELIPSVKTQLDSVQAFEFNRMVEGVDSYVMVAGGPDPFFAIADEQYVATLLHEMFHRYQFSDFAETSFVAQDVEGYDYSPENLELAMLEEEALKRAILAEPGSDEQREAARWVAAIRRTRLERDARVRLDGSQERYEGTARWLEHAVNISSARPTPESFAENVFGRSVSASDGVKDYFGFGRWYATGAALVELARTLGIDDYAAQIEAGTEPAHLLDTHLGLQAEDIDGLVRDARTALDEDGSLAAQAQELAARVPNEPLLFGDDAGATDAGDVNDGAPADGAEGNADDDFEDAEVITDAQFECLVEGGLDVESDEVEIDPALAEKCFD